MKIHLHQTHQTIACFEDIRTYLYDVYASKPMQGIHLFPESFLCGYPLQDLCLNYSFINSYQKHMQAISAWAKTLPKDDNIIFLMGGIKYTLTSDHLPKKIENVIYLLKPGEELQAIYTKMLLPNYDIFDEKKYFDPGKTVGILNFNKKNIALMICEDMWPNASYELDPTTELKKTGLSFDLIINLSASPYDLSKQEKRIIRAKEISHFLKAPFFYVNRVGGEDEILFDGQSFAVNGSEILVQLSRFKKDFKSINLSSYEKSNYQNINNSKITTTWESLFVPNIVTSLKKLPHIKPLTDNECLEAIEALGFGVNEYARKCGFSKFQVALSGGIDSCLVLTILKLHLSKTQNLEAIYMPSKFSGELSLDISKKLCQNLDIPFYILPIEDVKMTCKSLFIKHMHQDLQGLADENIQSRIRSTLLLARANQTNSIAINTSNKSEIAVGYSTIYGDSVGAISLLGDVYKSEVYMLAKYINKTHDNIIPLEVIQRPPTAELRDNQKDTDSLPPYDILDVILEGMLSYRLTAKQMIDMGLPSDDVLSVSKLYRNSEYKRVQFCPIIKIKPKSFGFGYRVPTSKDGAFYSDL